MTNFWVRATTKISWLLVLANIPLLARQQQISILAHTESHYWPVHDDDLNHPPLRLSNHWCQISSDLRQWQEHLEVASYGQQSSSVVCILQVPHTTTTLNNAYEVVTQRNWTQHRTGPLQYTGRAVKQASQIQQTAAIDLHNLLIVRRVRGQLDGTSSQHTWSSTMEDRRIWLGASQYSN